MKLPADHYGHPTPSVDFGLFAPPKAPNTIHIPAPSAPGSDSSRDAAELVSVDGECLRCLTWYAAQREPATRYELALAVYPPEPNKPEGRKVAGTGPACGRTNTLVELKYLEEIGRKGRSATLRVTPAGRAWLARRSEAA
jgi:hypothetical protein